MVKAKTSNLVARSRSPGRARVAMKFVTLAAAVAASPAVASCGGVGLVDPFPVGCMSEEEYGL